MHKSTHRVFVALGLAWLSSLSHLGAFAAGLREEAIRFRTEGYGWQQEGDLARAMGAYQKAVAVDPSYATPYNDLGILYEHMGRLDDARLAYQRALEIDPDYAAAHANIAILYEQIGETEKAIAHWLKRYELGAPEDAWTAHAEERLVALGVLRTYPGFKGKIFTRRRLIQKELGAHERSLHDFEALTERWDW